MALTPTALIATTGIMNGGGFGINTTMTNLFSQVNANPLVSGVATLRDPTILANVPGLGDTLSSLPAFIANASSTASAAVTQATNMLPSAGTMMGNKNFLQAFSGASSFGSVSAEYSAALNSLGNKSFADLGINVNNFTGVLSGGVSGLVPAAAGGLQTLASQASGGLSKTLASVDPAGAGANVLSDTLKTVGTGLKSFGSAFDFKQLSNFGTPQGLIESLQKQGLADKYGINEQISAAGYDPNNLKNIPASVLQPILAGVSGGDLTKITGALGVNPLVPLTNLSGMLNLSNFLPPQAMSVMGLAKAGPAAITGLGNTLTNLGVQASNFKMSDMIAGIETKSLAALDAVKELIPQSVKTTLQPLLGSGSGLFGNPTISDMVGTVSGAAHTTAFASISQAGTAVMSTSAGQTLNTAMTAMQTAAATGDTGLIATAKANLDTAVAALKSQISGNPELNKLATAANTGIADSVAHLAKEATNLSLAGVSLATGGTPANLGSGITPFLSFGTKIHNFGVDKSQLGYDKLFSGVATNDLTGDALQATLTEGRNLARTTSVGKPSSAVVDTVAETKSAAQSNIPALRTAYDESKVNYEQAINNFNASQNQNNYTLMKQAELANLNAYNALQSAQLA